MEEIERRITKARTQLILKKPFFGYLALHLEPKERKDLNPPTMGTDGHNLYYHPDFVMKTSDEHLLFVIAHEVLHPAFGDLWRVGTRDKLRWNIAADAVRNAQLAEEKFSVPPYAVMIPGAEKLSVEEVYEGIRVEVGPGGDGSGEGSGDESDSDSSGDGSGQEGSSGSGKGSTGSTKQKPGSKSTYKKDPIKGKIVDDHDIWKEADGEGKGDKEGKSNEQKWRENVSRARQMAKMQGVGAGSFEEIIDDLLNPKLNPKELLQDFIVTSAKCDWRYLPPNKRHLWRGLILPSTYGDELEIAVCIDTSGSMGQDELREGLSWIREICNQFSSYTIHLYQADYVIQSYDVVTPYTEFPTKIKGRGGTSFREVFEDIPKRGIYPTCLVYWTDLYGSFPDSPPQYPVMWLCTSNVDTVPFGTLVKYPVKGE